MVATHNGREVGFGWAQVRIDAVQFGGVIGGERVQSQTMGA